MTDCDHDGGESIVDRPGANAVCISCGEANPDGYEADEHD